jgi:hypothetical protein
MEQEYQLYQEIADHISKNENIEISQMFGKPCLKINGKAFVCFFQNEMVFKLQGDMHKEALGFKGSKLFDPSGKGRAMKEWVQIPYKFSDRWEKYAILALENLKTITK